jgi:hypothetical protein
MALFTPIRAIAAGVARLRLLLHFVDALEKHISNAAESAFSFSPAELRASLFFRANRKASRVPHSTAGTGLCHSRRRTEAAGSRSCPADSAAAHTLGRGTAPQCSARPVPACAY